MDASGIGSSARNVYHCRCVLLQRAKWALDEDELNTLQNRAAYFGLDKTKDFEDFKEKYLFAEQSLRTKGTGNYGVNWVAVKSKEYTKRFTSISDNPKANALAVKRSRNLLSARAGSNTEGIYAISLTSGKDVSCIINQHHPFGIKRTDKFIADINRAEERGEKVLLIHNHPGGSIPSRADLNELLYHNNTVGIVVGHDGSIYFYSSPDRKITEFDMNVAYRKATGYTEREQSEMAMELLSEQFHFIFKKM